MDITRKGLIQQRTTLEAKRVEALAMANQCVGAIAMVDALLKHMPEEAPSPIPNDNLAVAADPASAGIQ